MRTRSQLTGHRERTADLDIFVRPNLENSAAVYRALVQFGAPVVAHHVNPEDFAIPGTVYQIGLPPHRIDILTEISGVSFDDASANTVNGTLGGEQVRCIGLEALILKKRASGRSKDLADLEILEALRTARQKKSR